MMLLAQVAHEWQTRPSQLLELHGVEAWQMDAAVAAFWWNWKANNQRIP
jgi:hypothetical protein